MFFCCQFGVRGVRLLTCPGRRMGAGDWEGSDAFVVYSEGCQGVENRRSVIEIVQLSFRTKAITLAFNPGQCLRPQANQPTVAQRSTNA